MRTSLGIGSFLVDLFPTLKGVCVNTILLFRCSIVHSQIARNFEGQPRKVAKKMSIEPHGNSYARQTLGPWDKGQFYR
jgi:hypothetical protein